MRSDEKTPAEARKVGEFQVRVSYNPSSSARCPWCLQPISKHTDAQREACEHRFDTEMSRRTAGPLRIESAAGRL